MFNIIGLTFSLFLLPFVVSTDICSYISEDYCFHFGTSSCYRKICECQLANCTLLEENCNLSFWCSRDGNYKENNVPEISLKCADLKSECLAGKPGRERCFYYRDNCDSQDEQVLAKIGKKNKKKEKSLAKKCASWSRRCEKKNNQRNHFACRMERQRCEKYPRTPERTSTLDNSTLVESITNEENKNPTQTTFILDNSTSVESIVETTSSDNSTLLETITDKKKARKDKEFSVSCYKYTKKCAKVPKEIQKEHYACKMKKDRCQENTAKNSNNSTSEESITDNELVSEVLSDCLDLRSECLSGAAENMRCILYRDNCDSQEKQVLAKIANRTNTKKEKDLAVSCATWSRKCLKVPEERKKRHYACKMERKKCQQFPRTTEKGDVSRNSTFIESNFNNDTLIELL